jgi:rifampicin phosphotransferase
METPLPSQVSFEPPEPGHWVLDTVHAQRPMTRYSGRLMTEGLRRGFGESTARYGLMVDHMRMTTLHGFLYSQMVPFGLTPEGPLPPTHPDIQRRIETAERAFADKTWREDLRDWEERVKPAAIRAHRALQAVQPTTLSTEALVRHLRDVTEHLTEMNRLHHRYTLAHVLPVGDFLVHALAWTGRSTGELARLLKGASAASAQLGTSEPPALVRALREDPAALALLRSPAPAQERLERLAALPGAVGERMRDYLQEVGQRGLGYDVADPRMVEVPEALLGGIRGAVEGRSAEEDASEAAHLARMREAVPGEHRATFDTLLAEARSVYGLRDDRGIHTDGWAVGLARRALLAVGERLRQMGRLARAELVLDAEREELEALLAGAATPTNEELERRAHWRMNTLATQAPASLGPPPPPPPPLDRLPPGARRLNTALMFYMGSMFGDAPAQPTTTTSTSTSVKGLAVSPGLYEGIARVIVDQKDLERIQKGDVLVAATTSPYFNVVLPLLGAIVTDRGGQLCHAAIITREYGIPGIVGTREATKKVRDGARVRVNGTTGELQVLS